MSKDEEKQKAHDRGQELSPVEEALEDARDAFHADPSDEGAKAAFHAAQKAVAAERITARQARESEGPPPEATDVKRDATGKIFGWTTGTGDAVSAQGGRVG